MQQTEALVTNDAVVLGMLALLLGLVFWTSHSRHPFWRRFYGVVPALLLCYFLPSLLNTFGVVDAEQSELYYVSSRYLLPACLVLLTLSIDLPAIARLGRKALIMFFTGTVGILFGGPLALLIVGAVSPETVGGDGPDAVWRGLTTVAGSWIGGGANQTAMKEVFEVSNAVFSQMVAVDVIMANIWMAVLLFLSGRADSIDARDGADTRAIEDLKERVSRFQARHARVVALPDLMFMLAVAFGVTGFAHAVAGWLGPWIEVYAPALAPLSLTSQFFWILVVATTEGSTAQPPGQNRDGGNRGRRIEKRRPRCAGVLGMAGRSRPDAADLNRRTRFRAAARYS